LIELSFYVPLDTIEVILEMLFPANLFLTSTEKTKLKPEKEPQNIQQELSSNWDGRPWPQ